MNNTALLGTPPIVTHSGDDAFERRFVLAAPAAMAHVRSITSQHLFGEFPEVQIAHAGMVYRLRQTSLGKLILTK
jgi:hemin uptake protein HemP